MIASRVRPHTATAGHAVPLDAITALILTGGRGSRMGGRDKGLITLDGRRLVDIALDHVATCCDKVVISANRNQAVYAATGHTVVSDVRADYQGPLAGIESALEQVHTPLMLLLPVDCPHPPQGWVERLQSALAASPQARIAVPHDGERMQPLFSLLRTSVRDDLRRFLDDGERKVQAWVRRVGAVEVDFSDQPEAFTNLNTPQDLQRHE